MIGKIVDNEYVEFVYQNVNCDYELITGKCKSYPKYTENNKIELSEFWNWTCKDYSSGHSLIIDI